MFGCPSISASQNAQMIPLEPLWRVFILDSAWKKYDFCQIANSNGNKVLQIGMP